MKLTAKMLTDLAKALRSNHRDTPRRKNPRVGLRVRAIAIRTAGSTRRILVWVRDLSASGIQIVSSEEFKNGDDFGILLTGEKATILRCVATHCRRVSSGLFATGATFSDIRFNATGG